MDGPEVIDEAVVYRGLRHAEINIHGGPAVARRAMELLVSLGASAQARPRADADALPTAHPKWNSPAIGRELLSALPEARSRLVLAALTYQWSDGVSALAHEVERSADALAPGLIEALRSSAEGLGAMSKLLEPAEVVLAGPPNAGKSTLANALVGRQVSIVDETPGTTRDWVREPALLDGVPVWLTDTAGLWQRPVGVAAEAVRRARACVAEADLVLLLEAGEPFAAPAWMRAKSLLRIASKCDVAPSADPADATISALTGQGIEELKRAIIAALGLAGFDPRKPRAFTQRQADLLTRIADALETGRANEARALAAELAGRRETLENGAT